MSLTRGERVIAFIGEYCKVPEGAQVGKPLKLAEFQKKFIMEIYDNPHGTRKAFLSIARKNGKSGLIAAILLAHICGPEAVQNSQIVSGAMSRDQAALVFALAAKMINQDQRLVEVTRVISSGKRILGLAKNVEYKALAAEGSTAHGLSPVVAILDEIGQVKGPTNAFIEAVTTSQGAHESPLLIAISTSAPSDGDLWSMWIDDAIKSKDENTVVHEYKADDGSDLLDEEQWVKANPALGLFRSKKDLQTQLLQASRLPAMEAASRNLLLNQRVAQDSLFLAPAVWKQNNGAIDLEVFRNNPVSMGLDLSARNDLTAAVCAAMDADTGIVHLLPFVFCPANGIEERSRRDRAPYDVWVKQGKMFAIGGSSMDYEHIATYLRDVLDDLGITLTTVEFDRWRWEIFKKEADIVQFAQWATYNPVGQGFKDFAPRVEAFESLLLENRIRHGNHPLLNLAASNAIAISDPTGARKIDKSKSTQRIDPLIAAVMATFAVSEGNVTQAFDVSALIG